MIIHERSKTSRETRKIEERLAKSLEKIGTRIRDDPLFANRDIFNLREKYHAEVQSEIQMAVQETYLLGLKYVGDYEEINTLLTQRDLSQIEEQTKEQTETFWRAIGRDMVRTMQDRNPVQMTATAGLIATATATGTLALATLDKTRQLGDYESEITFITAVDEKVCPICRPLHGKSWAIGDPLIINPGSDTHPNCRCRLLLKDGIEVYSH